jgi:hypothetical protein
MGKHYKSLASNKTDINSFHNTFRRQQDDIMYLDAKISYHLTMLKSVTALSYLEVTNSEFLILSNLDISLSLK